jgi:hypothetical protein
MASPLIWQLNSTFSFGSQALLRTGAVCARLQSGLKHNKAAARRFMADVEPQVKQQSLGLGWQ